MGLLEILSGIIGIVMGIAKIIYFYLGAFYRKIVPPPFQSIDGETILVTGSAGAIGREICKHLVRSGNDIKLILWDLNLDALEKFAGELEAMNSTVKVFSFAVDISVKDNINKACKEVNAKVGAPTVIFNNAGILPAGNFFQLTNKEIEMTIQINLMSHIWIIRQLLGNMVVNNYGRIVNTCSIAGLIACPQSVPYFASKFGVNGYTESLKCELEQFEYDGIHVTTVYPYFVQTPLIETLVLNKGSGLPGPFSKFLNAKDVAKSAVDGMRMELEYVYCPSAIPLIVFADFLIPRKLRKILQGAAIPSFEYKDEQANKRLHETYLDTMRRTANEK